MKTCKRCGQMVDFNTGPCPNCGRNLSPIIKWGVIFIIAYTVVKALFGL